MAFSTSFSVPTLLSESTNPLSDDTLIDNFKYKKQKLRTSAKTKESKRNTVGTTHITDNEHQFLQVSGRHKENKSITYEGVNPKSKFQKQKRPVSFTRKTKLRMNYFPTKTDLNLANDASCFVKFKEKGKGFKRRYIVLTETDLLCYKANIQNHSTQIPVAIIPLEYAAIKRDKSNIFSIITPSATYSFQTDLEEYTTKFYENITEICNRLVLDSIASDDTQNESKNIENQYSEKSQEIWWMASASKCADCSDTNPEWASLNLGIFICVECSGVHRSFGTHVSQVKSVRLDMWTEEQTLKMKQLGNNLSNNIWEYNIPDNYTKITWHSSREERVEWLTLKYIIGRFRKDYVPSGPTMISSHMSRGEENKQILIDILKEDKEFCKELTNILFSDITN